VQQDLRGWNCRGKKHLTGNKWVTIFYLSDDANAANSFDKNKTIVLSCKHHQNRDTKSNQKKKKKKKERIRETQQQQQQPNSSCFVSHGIAI
jgi:hypothetical protein